MTEEWEYEAVAIQSQRDYLNSCPAICRKCRWLDTYYELGCTQLVYPNANNKCILYTHHNNYKRFKLFGYDFHYRLWQLKVWFCEKVLRMKRNHVGSWKQWEYEDNPDWIDDEDIVHHSGYEIDWDDSWEDGP